MKERKEKGRKEGRKRERQWKHSFLYLMKLWNGVFQSSATKKWISFFLDKIKYFQYRWSDTYLRYMEQQGEEESHVRHSSDPLSALYAQGSIDLGLIMRWVAKWIRNLAKVVYLEKCLSVGGNRCSTPMGMEVKFEYSNIRKRPLAPCEPSEVEVAPRLKYLMFQSVKLKSIVPERFCELRAPTRMSSRPAQMVVDKAWMIAGTLHIVYKQFGYSLNIQASQPASQPEAIRTINHLKCLVSHSIKNIQWISIVQ